MGTTARSCRGAMATIVFLLATVANAAAPGRWQPDRTVLPLQIPEPSICTELDARRATPPPRFEATAPEGAPNVLVVLIDDLGFAGTSTFGGPVPTPGRLREDG